ncbi:hypothetical protein MMC15_005218 [Xylographa vitiligo]|nr:hypothetical protein [Xylographa vitiligo]
MFMDFSDAGTGRLAPSIIICNLVLYWYPASVVADLLSNSSVRQPSSKLSREVFVKLNQESHHYNLDIDQISNICTATIKEDCRYFIIIDGLDECNGVELQQVLHYLESLLNVPNVTIKVYYSCRSGGITWSPPLIKQWQILIDPHTVELDINHYIQVTLEQKLEDESLELGDPSIILTIQKALMEKAQDSMGCLPNTEHLCAQRTDYDIIKALEDLPEDLPQIFERILRSLLQTNDIKFASRIFNWLAVAKRPLMLEELREAIAIQPRKTEFDAAYLVNDITQTLICCGCLVFVDEEQETVHFTRHSVKQYLLQRSSDPLPSDYHVEIEVADTYAGEICITYLSFDVLIDV